VKKLLVLFILLILAHANLAIAQRSARSSGTAASSRTAVSSGVPALQKIGFGASATGGEGGTTINVTNLNDSGAGSFRAALTASGTRIIKATVQGVITLNTLIEVQNGNFTIDFTDAPGKGICIAGEALAIKDCSNFIIRGLRRRATLGSHTDALRIDGSDTGIIDHCTFSWGIIDGNLDLSNGASDVTIQYCLFADNMGPGHNLNFYDSTRITTYQCAYYNGIRCPEVGYGQQDFVNNLIYRNWDFEGDGAGQPQDRFFENLTNVYPGDVEISGALNLDMNIEGNLYIAGPDEQENSGKKPVYLTTGFRTALIFLKQNSGPSRTSDGQTEVSIALQNNGGLPLTTTRHSFPRSGMTVLNPFDSGFEAAILSNSGAIYPCEDSYDTQVKANIVARAGGTGNWGPIDDIADVGGMPDYSGSCSGGGGNPRQAASSRTPVAMIIIVADRWSLMVMPYGLLSLALLAIITRMMRRHRKRVV
jgi:pectate lyase